MFSSTVAEPAAPTDGDLADLDLLCRDVLLMAEQFAGARGFYSWALFGVLPSAIAQHPHVQGLDISARMTMAREFTRLLLPETEGQRPS